MSSLPAPALSLRPKTLPLAEPEWVLTCDVCGVTNDTVDDDARREVDVICEACREERDEAPGHVSRWDHGFDQAHAAKEQR